jgi:hypothetical protein
MKLLLLALLRSEFRISDVILNSETGVCERLHNADNILTLKQVFCHYCSFHFANF